MSSELLRKIETDSVTVEDGIELIDIKLQNSFISTGKLRLYNAAGELEGAFNIDDDISVSMAWNQDGTNSPTKIFTGYVTDVQEEEILRLEVQTFGGRMREASFKKSYNKAKVSRIFNDIMSGQNIDFETGVLNQIQKHTFISPDESLIDEIQRVDESFELDLIPYFDREGKLILKTLDELLTETGIEFNDDEFVSFENNTLETVLDVDIFLFDKLKVLGVDYYVTAHQFYSDDKRTKSFIDLDTI